MGERYGFETLAIHAGQEPDPGTGSVVVPIHQTSTYKQDGVGGLRGGYEYSRSANRPDRAGGVPGRARAARTGWRSLWAGRRGHAAHRARPATRRCLDDTHGGSFRSPGAGRLGVEHTAVSSATSTRSGPRSPATKVLVRDAVQPHAARHSDLAAEPAAHDQGTARGRQHVRLAIPAQPLGSRGRVVHSTTKYLGGHWTWSAARWCWPTAGWPSNSGPPTMGGCRSVPRLVLRGEDARCPDGPAQRERAADRRDARRAPGGGVQRYPDCRPPGTRWRQADAQFGGMVSFTLVAVSQRRCRSASGPRSSSSASRSAGSSR